MHHHKKEFQVKVRSAGTEPRAVINDGPWSSGSINVPASAAATALTFYRWDPVNSVWVQAYTAANAAISITVAASRAYPVPAELLPLKEFVIVGNSDDSTRIFTVNMARL